LDRQTGRWQIGVDEKRAGVGQVRGGKAGRQKADRQRGKQAFKQIGKRQTGRR
jgi:hypothetical protein